MVSVSRLVAVPVLPLLLLADTVQALLVAHDVTPTNAKDVNIHIFGLFNTGTNLMQTVLNTAFPRASVCPDTRTHMKATGVKTCFSDFTSKHSHPVLMEDWLRSRPDTFAVIMVRDPFSSLLSTHKEDAAYGLSACSLGKHWLEQTCVCGPDMREPDKLCAPQQMNFTSVPDVWNTYAKGQLALASDPELRKRIRLVRYEDLILNASAVLSDIGAMVKVSPGPVGNSMAASSSRNSTLRGATSDKRATALAQIRTHSFLQDYSRGDLARMCSTLDSTLLRRLSYGEVSYTKHECSDSSLPAV